MAALYVARRRKDYVSQQLVGLEHVLALDVLLRRHREIVRRADHPFAPRPEQPERRIVGDKRHRETRRMDDVAGAVAEDRMELVFALGRETPVAALLVADELFVAEVPAA